MTREGGGKWSHPAPPLQPWESAEGPAVEPVLRPPRGSGTGLFRPGVALNDLDEISTYETGNEVSEDVCVYRAEGRIGAIPEAVCESRQDLSLEVRTRMGGGDRLDLSRVEVLVADAENVGLDSGRDQSDLGSHELGNARSGMQCDARPYTGRGVLGDAVGGEEPARLVGPGDRETLFLGALPVGEAEVVEHRADVEQFGVRAQAAPLPLQHPEQIDP